MYFKFLVKGIYIGAILWIIADSFNFKYIFKFKLIYLSFIY